MKGSLAPKYISVSKQHQIYVLALRSTTVRKIFYERDVRFLGAEVLCEGGWVPAKLLLIPCLNKGPHLPVVSEDALLVGVGHLPQPLLTLYAFLELLARNGFSFYLFPMANRIFFYSGLMEINLPQGLTRIGTQQEKNCIGKMTIFKGKRRLRFSEMRQVRPLYNMAYTDLQRNFFLFFVFVLCVFLLCYLFFSFLLLHSSDFFSSYS